MSRRLVPLLGFLVLVAFGVWFFGRDAAEAGTGAAELENAPAVGPVQHEEQSEVETRAAEPVAAPGRQRTTIEETEEDPPAYRRALASLKGRVLWEHDRSPVAHTEIRCLEVRMDLVTPDWGALLQGAQDADPLRTRATTRTDAEGRFELRGVHAHGYLVLLIGLGTEAMAVRFVDDAPRPAEEKDIGDLLLQQRGGVRGQILAPSGQPVVGARVRVLDLPGIALDFGVGRFDPEGLVVVQDRPEDVQVIAMPAWVRRHFDEIPFPGAVTDAEGRFEIRGARPGRSRLVAQDARYPILQKDVIVRAGVVAELSPARFDEGETLAGRVVDEGGQPVAGVELTAGALLPMVPVAVMPRPILSDEKGRFRITGLGRGKLLLAYRAPGHPSWSAKGPLRPTEELELVVPALYSATVRVVDENQKPLADAELRVGVVRLPIPMPGAVEWLDPAVHVERVEGEEGLFRLQKLAGGEHRVLANAPGHAANVLELQLGPEAGAEETLVLGRAATFAIEVRDPVGMPVHAARVYWQQHGTRTRNGVSRTLSQVPILLGRTDADGRLQVESVEAGAEGFVAMHPAFAPGHAGEQAARPGATLQIRLVRPARIVGHVFENGRVPEQRRMISAQPSWRTRSEFRELLVPPVTTTREDGSFELAGLLPGEYTVIVLPRTGGLASPTDIYQYVRRIEGGARPAMAQTQVPLGGVATVRIEIGEGKAVLGSGRIYGSFRVDGQVPAETLVRLRGKSRDLTELDERGGFLFDGLADGVYVVEFRQADTHSFQERQLWQERVEIKEGTAAPVHVDLRMGRLELTLLAEDGAPLHGQLVEIRGRPLDQESGSNLRFQGSTNAQGTVVFAAVTPGSYVVRSEGGRDRPIFGEHRLEVPSGRTVQRELQAVHKVKLAGTLRFDLSALSEEEKQWLGDDRPRWLSGSVAENHVFVQIVEVPSNAPGFRANDVPPGRMELQGWSQRGISWASEPIEVQRARDDLEIVLAPVQATLRRRMEQEKKEKEKQQQGK